MATAAAADAHALPPLPERASLTAWIAVAAGTLGAFMATLDISIVNSSLPVIQGEIGATGTEGTWVATSYLVAEIVVISLSAWLERVLGMRTFLLIATALFTAFSVMCGLSTNLTMMIIGRVGQGITGGALIPTAQAIVATRIPRSQQTIGIAAMGFTATMGPVAGPVVGGWLTETLSWHYAFFLNVPVGILSCALLLLGLPHEPARPSALREADWPGIIGLTLGLGGLTVLLEEGQREQWFDSFAIRWMAVTSVVGFILLAIGQVTAKRPVLKLRLLLDRQFGAIITMVTVFGAVAYGSSYAIPQFLASVANYNALQSGQVVFLSGVPTLAVMFLSAIMIKRLDMRLAVFVGMASMAIGCHHDTTLTLGSDGGDFVFGQLIRGFGQATAIVFLNMGAISSVPRADAGDASGLINAARNMGGTIVLAAIAVIQDQRIWLHTRRLEETLNANSVAVQDYVGSLAGAMGGMPAAMRQIDAQLQANALVMTFNDIFWLISVATFAVAPLAIFLRPIRNVEAAPMAH